MVSESSKINTLKIISNNAFLTLIIAFYTKRCIVGFEMIMTFGGSPTGVAAPPIFENMTKAMSTCLGSMFLISQSLIVTGVISNMVVTLSKNADNNPVKQHNVIIKGQICPFANLKAYN